MGRWAPSRGVHTLVHSISFRASFFLHGPFVDDTRNLAVRIHVSSSPRIENGRGSSGRPISSGLNDDTATHSFGREWEESGGGICSSLMQVFTRNLRKKKCAT
ncbi:hypothetical protein MRX96_039012 [Rhipicephalus microplus]